MLSTIHTNDALSAVNRLVDMGIEPFLLASTLRVLEAQRLVRRLCKECKEPVDCDAETAERYGFEVGQTLYRPKGCDSAAAPAIVAASVFSRWCGSPPDGEPDSESRRPLPELLAAARRREEGMKLLR